jgi:hypothetical protein
VDCAPSSKREAKSPSKADVKQERDSLEIHRVNAKRGLTFSGIAKRSLHYRSKLVRKNVRASVLRGVSKGVAAGKSALDTQREELLSEMKCVLSEIVRLKNMIKLRSANLNPVALRGREPKSEFCVRHFTI